MEAERGSEQQQLGAISRPAHPIGHESERIISGGEKRSTDRGRTAIRYV